MTAAIDTERVIDRPIDVVWAHLTDWEQGPRWMNGIDSMAIDGPTVAGATMTFHTRGKDRTSIVATAEPGRAVTLRSVQGGVTAEYEYRLEAIDDDRTRATLVAECRSDGLLWRLVGPLTRVAIRRTDGGQLDALKAWIEAAPA